MTFRVPGCRYLSLSGLLLVLMASLLVGSCRGKVPITPVNADGRGLAIKGYDTVAYFTDGKPAKGSPDFEFIWKSAKWRFVSREHVDLFRSDPERYAPRYGGYCAYAVSQGKTADIDPHQWTIHEGKLYLNLNHDVQGLWLRDRDAYIRKADENWPHLAGKK